MSYKQNLHTHSTYCDGKDTPREMIETALSKGFDSIGFSGHSYTSFALQYCMSLEGTQEYIKEINQLKKEFEDKIKIYCGIELEMYSKVDVSPYDYVIGSVHYFDIDGEIVGFDRSQEEVERVINAYFGGDGMAYAKEYYKSLTLLPQCGDIDIIGHFDLINKHCENANFFDIESKEYLGYAFEAARALAGKIPFFEVNTGAISRGYRTTPYPTVSILKELKRLGFGAVISSDCHNREHLDCNYAQAAELLKHCGFKERYVLTDSGFKAVAI